MESGIGTWQTSITVHRDTTNDPGRFKSYAKQGRSKQANTMRAAAKKIEDADVPIDDPVYGPEEVKVPIHGYGVCIFTYE